MPLILGTLVSLVLALANAITTSDRIGNLEKRSPHGTRFVSRFSESPAQTAHRLTGVHFVENRGQWPDTLRFEGLVSGAGLRVFPDGFALSFGAHEGEEPCARWVFEGASPAVRVVGEGQPTTARWSYFLGNDPERWRAGIPSFEGVRWRGLYEGIDLVLHVRHGVLEYDLELAPEADLGKVRVKLEGASGLTRLSDGSIAIELGTVEVTQRPPRSFVVEANGALRAVESAIVPTDGGFGFSVPSWSGEEGLVVDPELHWSSYLGGTTNPWGTGDFAEAVAFGPDGDVYITGYAGATDFPVTSGTWHSATGAGGDSFVARFRGSDGALVYCTVFGGSAHRGQWQTSGRSERPRDLAVGATGEVTVVGFTDAGDFPTTPGAFQRDWLGPRDAYILRLSPLGDALIYATLLGGSWHDDATAVAIGPSGAAVVGGFTEGAQDFPTTSGAFKRDFDGTGGMSFLTRFSPDGSLLEWSTYLGGTQREYGVKDLALDSFEQVTATGYTGSDNFPVTPGTWNPTPGIDNPAYVTRLDPSGSALVWSCLFGASGVNSGNNVESVALTPDGGVVVGGWCTAPGFPTTPGAFQTDPNIEDEGGGFVVRLEPDGSDAVYSTWLQSPVWGSRIYSIAVDASGCVTVAGDRPQYFPLTPGAYDTNDVYQQGFVARLNPSGTQLLYSTLLGSASAHTEVLNGIDVGPTRRVAIAAATQGEWPVTPGAYDTTFNGGQSDAAVAVFDLVLEGSRNIGESTPACRGPLHAAVNRAPVSGADDFALTCSGAPPSSLGFFLMGRPGFKAIGQTQLGLTGPSLRRPVFSDVDGWAEAPMPLPPRSSGLTFACQFAFETSTACPGPERWSTSQGLVVSLR